MNILQLSDLSKLFIATYMFKHLNSNNIPITLSHHYSTRNKHTLNTPRHNLTIYGQSLMYKGPTVWNSVPQYVKECNSTSSFKGESYNIRWKIPFFFFFLSFFGGGGFSCNFIFSSCPKSHAYIWAVYQTSYMYISYCVLTVWADIIKFLKCLKGKEVRLE